MTIYFLIFHELLSKIRVLPINGPDPMAQWPNGPMALWPNGPMAQRHYGTIVWCMFMTNA